MQSNIKNSLHFCHKYYSGRETFHFLAPKSKFSSICAEVIVFVTNLHNKPILPQEGRLALISFPMCCLLSFTNFTAAALYSLSYSDMPSYSNYNVPKQQCNAIIATQQYKS